VDAELGHAAGIARPEATQVVKLIVSSAAAADLARLREFLLGKNAAAAQRAVAGIVQTIDSLAAYPDRGKPCGIEGLRDLIVPFGRSAYIVRYAHDPQRQEIVIVRVWHGREARV
jgi:plasmid stabilization system protein ParE